MQKTRGFSLIELAVVLTVMAILSTAAVPGMIAAARGKYGERLVADISNLQEAAEAYYHQNGDQWPALSEGECSMNPSLNAVNVLKNEGFLTCLPRDPFSNEHYLISYAEQNGECHLRIHTPRNAKLSPVLGKLNATLKLIGQQNCQAENNLVACTFAFVEPKLGRNFGAIVEDEVDNQMQGMRQELKLLEEELDDFKNGTQKNTNQQITDYDVQFHAQPNQPNHAVCQSGFKATACTSSNNRCKLMGTEGAKCEARYNRGGEQCTLTCTRVGN